MPLVTRAAATGLRGIDSLPFSQGGRIEDATALAQSGIEFVALYLGVAKPAQANAVFDAGLGAFGVTVAGAFDGSLAVSRAQELGLARGTSLYLDLEGHAVYTTDPARLIGEVNGWAQPVKAAGYVPCLYVASPQPLTSDELWKLEVERYWRAPSRIVDRFDNLAEPTGCGWSMYQCWPSRRWAGIFVDANIVSADFKGRTPMMTWRE